MLESLQGVSVPGIFVILLLATITNLAKVLVPTWKSRMSQMSQKPPTANGTKAVMADSIARIDRRTESTAAEVTALVPAVRNLSTSIDRLSDRIDRVS